MKLMTTMLPSLFDYSNERLNHSEALIDNARPKRTISSMMFASYLYQESRIRYQMLRKVLVMIKVKKIATSTSAEITFLKAMLNAIKIQSKLNQTKYIITTNLLLLSP